MIRFEHVFLNIDGNQYYDYIGHVDTNSYYTRRATPDMPVISGNIKDLLCNNIDSLLDNTISPNDGDQLHVVPDCVYAIADIRNNYQIKRGFDAGMYNVYSPLKQNLTQFFASTIVVVQKYKQLVLFNREFNFSSEAKKEAKRFVPEAQEYDMVVFKKKMSLFYSSCITPYIPLLNNTATKPCISYKKLKFNSNELTPDVLMFVYKAGNAYKNSLGAEENYLLQLSILNQHNWREYPRTMFILFNVMLQYKGIHHEVKSHASKYPKHVKEIFEMARSQQDYKDEKDFNMARDFVSMVLDVKPCAMFVDTKRLMEKLSACSFGMTIFNELFSTVTRIVPKKYEG